MYGDYRRSAEKIGDVIRQDLAKVAENLGSLENKSALCFMSHRDSRLGDLLGVGFGSITAVAAKPEALENQREKYENQQNVTFKLDVNGDFFDHHVEEFDFVFFSNIHDPDDVPIYIEKAVAGLKKGGYIYFFEPRRPGWYGNLLAGVDAFLASLGIMMAGSKHAFVRKAAACLGFSDPSDLQEGFDGVFSGISGIDEMQVLRRLKRNLCRPVVIEYSRFPATLPFEKLQAVVKFPEVFRILAVKD